MNWLTANGFWVLIGIAFLAMHLFGHGGHGGHCGHGGHGGHGKHGAKNPDADDPPDRDEEKGHRH